MARTLSVGPGQEFATPAALPQLLPGDVVEIHSGVYKTPRKYFGGGTASQPVIIRGVGPTKPVFDGRGLTLSIPRAFFELYGSSDPKVSGQGYWIVENVECRYAQNRASEMNAACVRNVNSASVTIRNMKAWNNCSGVMSSEASGDTIIEDSDIGFNGYGDGHSHNLYLMGQRAIVRRSRIHDSIVGQNIKTRNRFVELSYNEIYNSQDGEIGIIQAGDGTPAGAALTSQPNSNALVVGNIITTRASRGSGNCCTVVVFGQDMGTVGRNGTLYFTGNTVQALASNSMVHLKLDGSEVGLDARYNWFLGSKLILDQREATNKPIVGMNNWAEAGARIPAGFSTPALFPFVDAAGAALEARPGVFPPALPISSPQNVEQVLGQGGQALKWDPVPGAAFYRIYRQPRINGVGQWRTIWGGSVDASYVDTFQQPVSSLTTLREYLYSVAAVDSDGNESARSETVVISR